MILEYNKIFIEKLIEMLNWGAAKSKVARVRKSLMQLSFLVSK